MRIGMVVYNLDVSGGYQKLVLRSAQSMSNLGHEVTIYTLSVDRKNCYPDLIKRVRVESLHQGKNLISEGFSPINEFQELSYLIASDLDGLIIHDPYSLHVLNFYKSQKKSFKSAWMVNNQIPAEFAKYLPLFINLLKPSVHNLRSIKSAIARLIPQLKETYFLRAALKKLDLAATYDVFNKKLAERLGKKSIIVYAGADLDEFAELRKKRKISKESKFKVLSVGVVFPHRRYEDLIEAVYLLSKEGFSVEATIVGLHKFSPDYSQLLKKKAVNLKLEERILFLEYLTDRKLKELYRSSDAFVFINDGFTWGISVFEAVAAGLPVIITDNIGAGDIIENERYGWVVPPRNPKEVAEALKEIISKPNKVSGITVAAYNRVKKLVSWDAYAQRMVKLLK